MYSGFCPTLVGPCDSPVEHTRLESRRAPELSCSESCEVHLCAPFPLLRVNLTATQSSSFHCLSVCLSVCLSLSLSLSLSFSLFLSLSLLTPTKSHGSWDCFESGNYDLPPLCGQGWNPLDLLDLPQCAANLSSALSSIASAFFTLSNSFRTQSPPVSLPQIAF